MLTPLYSLNTGFWTRWCGIIVENAGGTSWLPYWISLWIVHIWQPRFRSMSL